MIKWLNLRCGCVTAIAAGAVLLIYSFDAWAPAAAPVAVASTQSGQAPNVPLLHDDESRQPRPLVALKPDQLAVRFRGRLGNLMFQYASLLGLAAVNNKTPTVPCNLLLADAFQLFTAVPADSVAAAHYDRLPLWAAVSPQLFRLPPGSFLVDNYLQSWRYFHNVQQLVRQNFRFRPYIERLADEHMRAITSRISKQQREVVVAVHVRRGDTATNERLRQFGYTSASGDYLRRAVRRMGDLYGAKRTLFVVCSDDYAWTTQALASVGSSADRSSPRVAFCPEINDPFVDLALLTRFANHTIMSVGSFSWWTAWLVNGTTLYYDLWPQPGSPLADGFRAADYFMPHWIPMH